MGRIASIVVLAGLLVAAGSAHAAPPRVTLSARASTCTTGADPAESAATFTGSMPALTGTRRMQMRFALQQRRGAASPTASFKSIDVPDWRAWEKSDPGRPGFVFTERVEGLPAPAGYRAVVTFRWYDRRGHLQRETRRTTGVCEQPDPRPDLVFDALAAVGTDATQAAYTVSVRNDGVSAAGAFGVTLTMDGVTTAPIPFGSLAAGAAAQGAVLAPRCAPGSSVTVVVDAGNAVAERTESDDAVVRPCPFR